MKTAILIMMLGVAPAAYAQSSPPQISDQDVKTYWLLFQKLQHSVEDPGGTLAVLRPSGMSEVGAAEFSRFALQALDDHLRAVNERMVGMCQHQEALKASRNAFADALDQNKTASEAMKRALVANLGVGLTAEDEEKVRTWALIADQPTIYEFPDIGQLIRSGQTDHVRGVEKTCERVAAAPPAGAAQT